MIEVVPESVTPKYLRRSSMSLAYKALKIYMLFGGGDPYLIDAYLKSIAKGRHDYFFLSKSALCHFIAGSKYLTAEHIRLMFLPGFLYSDITEHVNFMNLPFVRSSSNSHLTSDQFIELLDPTRARNLCGLIKLEFHLLILLCLKWVTPELVGKWLLPEEEGGLRHLIKSVGGLVSVLCSPHLIPEQIEGLLRPEAEGGFHHLIKDIDGLLDVLACPNITQEQVEGLLKPRCDGGFAEFVWRGAEPLTENISFWELTPEIIEALIRLRFSNTGFTRKNMNLSDSGESEDKPELYHIICEIMGMNFGFSSLCSYQYLTAEYTYLILQLTVDVPDFVATSNNLRSLLENPALNPACVDRLLMSEEDGGWRHLIKNASDLIWVLKSPHLTREQVEGLLKPESEGGFCHLITSLNMELLDDVVMALKVPCLSEEGGLAWHALMSSGMIASMGRGTFISVLNSACLTAGQVLQLLFASNLAIFIKDDPTFLGELLNVTNLTEEHQMYILRVFRDCCEGLELETFSDGFFAVLVKCSVGSELVWEIFDVIEHFEEGRRQKVFQRIEALFAAMARRDTDIRVNLFSASLQFLDWVVRDVSVEALNALACAEFLTIYQHLLLRYCAYRDIEFTMREFVFPQRTVAAGEEESKSESEPKPFMLNTVCFDALVKAKGLEGFVCDAMVYISMHKLIGLDDIFGLVLTLDDLNTIEASEAILILVSYPVIQNDDGTRYSFLDWCVSGGFEGFRWHQKRWAEYVKDAVSRAIDKTGLVVNDERCKEFVGSAFYNALEYTRFEVSDDVVALAIKRAVVKPGFSEVLPDSFGKFGSRTRIAQLREMAFFKEHGYTQREHRVGHERERTRISRPG